MKIRVCRSNQVQVDIDAPHATRKRRKFYQALCILTRETLFDYNWLDDRRSKSGKGYHITLTRSINMTVFERNYYAMLLGDDHWRSLFGHVRAVQHRRHPILFFEKSGPR